MATLTPEKIFAAKVATEKSRQPQTGRTGGHQARTILHNDDYHTFHEGAHQLVKAIRCTFAEGMAIAKVVHNSGVAVVYVGPLARWEAVAMTLEEIALKVSIER